ncbi:MAG: SufS family cysteine desulfurase [Gemmatimonadaceae bacterium]|nr:SufS family cysteine desulfurase [Gemmatimonadaceae bacterium]MDQ3242708.1 SufS family cysteine desulfurase [Gemmatimonadota bacterium]
MSHRGDFPLLTRNPGLHYLDSAATSHKPAVVLDAMREFYETSNANPHRGAYELSVAATDCYAGARSTVARFLGIGDPECLVFTRGTTESINLVASSWGRSNVFADDEIVVTALEHHANFVPWQQLAIERGAKLRICETTEDGRLDLDCLRGLLSRRTKILAFNHVSNALGTINPVRNIVLLARELSDAVIVCDGAQSAPHFRVHYDDLGVDFYAFSGHKMCGPMGIGGLVGRRALFDAMPPYQTGGDMIEFVHDDTTTWNVLPNKFEAGTPNAAGAVGLAAAAEYLDRIGMDEVLRHERELVASADARLREIEGVRIYGPPPADRSGVVSFTLDDVHPHDLATILDGEGVCIRAGNHCAQPLMRRLDVSATARASYYVYNDSTDTDALVEGVLKAREVFGHAAV